MAKTSKITENNGDIYTVVSTMKNEGPFIIDWVAHYKVLGFDHILVCNNDCSDTTVEILQRLQEMGLVIQHNTIIRGGGIHRSALRQASRRYAEVMDAKWVFVCDVDEYLNIHIGDGSVRDLVAASGTDSDIVSIPWRIFGSAGIDKFVEKPVTKQFTDAELAWDEKLRPTTGKFVKSLYCNQHKFKRMGLHAPIPREEHLSDIKHVLPCGGTYLENGVRTSSPPSFEHAQVNHYAVRSLESYLVKRARGRANHTKHELGVEYWQKFNLSGEIDTSIKRYNKETAAIVSELKKDPILKELHDKSVEWHKRKAASMKMDPDMDEMIAQLKS